MANSIENTRRNLMIDTINNVQKGADAALQAEARKWTGYTDHYASQHGMEITTTRHT